MIKIEHIVTPSPDEMNFVIEGMRNPLNSWDKSDSELIFELLYSDTEDEWDIPTDIHIGEKDQKLMYKLRAAGTDHRKYMRQMPLYMRITAPLYWWKEFDTYKVGTVSNSCSTMHKIAEKEFKLYDFSLDHIWVDGIHEHQLLVGDTYYTPLDSMRFTVNMLNFCREKYLETNDKEWWWQMIQLLPSSYNQTRNVSMNYEVAANIYRSRKGHKLDEWKEFCKMLETLPYWELITGET